MEIYRYKQFILENIKIGEKDTTSIDNLTNRLESLKKDISEFNSKKQALETAILDNAEEEEEKDITNIIDNIVGENKFLSMYLPIARKIGQIKKAELRIEYYSDLLDNREDDLQATSKLKEADEKQEQQKKLKEQIADIKEKSSDLEDKIKELESTIEQEKADMEEYIEDERSDMEEGIEELRIDLDV